MLDHMRHISHLRIENWTGYKHTESINDYDAISDFLNIHYDAYKSHARVNAGLAASLYNKSLFCVCEAENGRLFTQLSATILKKSNGSRIQKTVKEEAQRDVKYFKNNC